MMPLSSLFRRFSRRRRYDDLSVSIQEHIEERTDELMGEGMSPEAAAQAARREFGNVTLIQERSREAWQWPKLESLLAYIKYSFRQLHKSPGFALTVILTIAMGIGANLTIFLIVDGVLLQPLPFPQPKQLVRINRFYPLLHNATIPAYSGTKALFLSRNNKTLAATAIYDYIPSRTNLMRADGAIPLKDLRVTAGFFRAFGLEPELGRGFDPRDTLSNAPGVAVISDSLWKNEFGGDPHILGRSITLGQRSFTIVGVANPHFRLDSKVDVWTPLSITESPNDQSNMYNFVGRLKHGVSLIQAQSDLRRVLSELKTTYPNLWDRNESLRLVDLHQSFVGQMRPALELLMGSVLLVLLLVSTNILSLLLTRSIARRGEISLRRALGASTWRILWQLWTESMLYCTLGSLLGLAAAWLATPALMRLSPFPVPQFARFSINGTALLFTGALALSCALIFSSVPALEVRRISMNDSLRLNTTRVTSGRNLPQKSLVVGEVAISLVLLIVAGLLLTSFWKLLHVSPGFDSANVVTFKSTFSGPPATNTAALTRQLDELVQRLEAQPGVEAAAAVNTLPTQITPTMPFDIAGRSTNNPNHSGSEDYLPITPDYFKALNIPLVRGREFRLSDKAGATPVLIVNEQFARTYFKGQNPIGQHLRIGAMMGPGFKDQMREIVGVVRNTKNSGLDKASPGIMYLPQAQIPDAETQLQVKLLGVSWVVRTKTNHIDIIDAARRIFWNDARTPLYEIQPLSSVIGDSIAQQRFTMILIGCFGFISLCMGAIGLYGVMSYTVANRTKEIGVRMALGADRRGILFMVLGEAGVLVGIGLVIGFLVSLAAVQLLQSLLFHVSPRDPYVLIIGCGVLLLTGLVSAWQPARRASYTEPMQALRAE